MEAGFSWALPVVLNFREPLNLKISSRSKANYLRLSPNPTSYCKVDADSSVIITTSQVARMKTCCQSQFLSTSCTCSLWHIILPICQLDTRCKLGTRLGFVTAVMKVLRIRRNGLLAAGLPCNSWIFINRSTSGRPLLNIFGTTAYKYVRQANQQLSHIWRVSQK